MVKIILCFSSPFFLCSFIHLIYHTCLCQHLLFLWIFLHLTREESSGEWGCSLSSVPVTGSGLEHRNHLPTIYSIRECGSASSVDALRKKRIQIFSSVRIPRNFLEVFPRQRTAENTNAETWGWIEDVGHVGDILEKERKCSHLST